MMIGPHPLSYNNLKINNLQRQNEKSNLLGDRPKAFGNQKKKKRKEKRKSKHFLDFYKHWYYQSTISC